MTKESFLWKPSSDFIDRSNLKKFERWLAVNKGLIFSTYESMREWSIHHIDDFWESVWQFFEVNSSQKYEVVRSNQEMPGTKWFVGARINYAEHIFRHKCQDRAALVFAKEDGSVLHISWEDLERQVKSVATHLKSIGLAKGDSVVAYLPNIPEAIVSFLAVNSLGAVWSIASPDFGVNTVIDRFEQIKPKVLIAIDGYRYGGKSYSRIREVSQIQKSIQDIKETIIVPYLGEDNGGVLSSFSYWNDVSSNIVDTELAFVHVPFDHPIWVLYSSGTTGKPKAITHSHGGMLLEHLKYMSFHNDVHSGENFFWFTTTGWMMWNFLQASMLVGATPVLYDGSPGFPNLDTLWKLAAELPIHHFGTSAPYLVACMKAELAPGRDYDLSQLRSVGSTGAPLPSEAFEWVYDGVGSDIWLCSMSGGTDVCTAFVGGSPYLPVQRGRIQARALGVNLQAWNEEGQEVGEGLGEMVITDAMPSMPIYFWNDEDMVRYKSSYFEKYPGVWRHGDWINIFDNGSLVIHGRSDATLNRKGIRIGTAEIYAVLDHLDVVTDSLVLNIETSGGSDVMPLFVVLSAGRDLSAELVDHINKEIRKQCSPRHVPDFIKLVPGIPYTLSGKKMEVPVKKLLIGMEMSASLQKDAVRNPEALDYFESYAATFRKTYL